MILRKCARTLEMKALETDRSYADQLALRTRFPFVVGAIFFKKAAFLVKKISSVR